MDILAKVLYIIGAIPTILGLAILVILAPRPRELEEHLQGLARYLLVGGAGFGAARVLTGSVPTWNAVMFMLGAGLTVAIYARQNHLHALFIERLHDGGQESGV
jgi:hypothetical protein